MSSEVSRLLRSIQHAVSSERARVNILAQLSYKQQTLVQLQQIGVIAGQDEKINSNIIYIPCFPGSS